MAGMCSFVTMLIRFMPPDQTSGNGAQNTMVSGVMSGCSADDRSFDTSLCLSGGGRGQ